uniref:Uncharacterized protein n=1 Tax=viral metagenome TaxID=1070528 RepID=A0A6M3LT70_9ZZZZ
MNDEGRRLLTEYMGECFHSNYLSEEGRCYDCKAKIDFTDIFLKRRTFTTGQDIYDLYRKMVEKGEWDDFYNWMALQEDADYKEQVFNAFLFHTDRIPLVVEWIKAQGPECFKKANIPIMGLKP